MDTKVSIYDSCKDIPINEWEELLTPGALGNEKITRQ